MVGISFHTRKLNSGKVWYFQVKRPDGSYSPAKNTRCTLKKDAIKYAEDYIEKYGILMPGKDVSFEQF
ncbi:MAG TPA: hypothetical protein PKK43_13455, partial [Spirochaetota bacterium]|nr:hypothetical protein [Spirochaetota bacterium]